MSRDEREQVRDGVSTGSNDQVREASIAKQEDVVSVHELVSGSDVIRGEHHALSRLLQAWRVAATGSNDLSCFSIEARYGLRCLKDRGSWQDLQTINRVKRHGCLPHVDRLRTEPRHGFRL